MQRAEDPNAALGQELTEIIRAATCGPISEQDARLLCYGCGLDAKVVVPPQNPVDLRVVRAVAAAITQDETNPF